MTITTIETSPDLDAAIELQMRIDNGRALAVGIPEFTRETWIVEFLRQRLAGILQRIQQDKDSELLSKLRSDPALLAQVEAKR